MKHLITKSIAFGSLILLLSHCAQRPEMASTEAIQKVLAKSIFSEGGKIPQAEEFALLTSPAPSEMSTDSGFIAPPDLGNGGADTGSILPPGTPESESGSTSTVDPSTESNSPVSEQTNTDVSQNPDPLPANTGGGETVVNPIAPVVSENDSGNIGTPSSGSGEDQGSVSDSTSVIPDAVAEESQNSTPVEEIIETVDNSAVTIDDSGSLVNNDQPNSGADDTGSLVNNDQPTTPQCPTQSCGTCSTGCKPSCNSCSKCSKCTSSCSKCPCKPKPQQTASTFKFKLRRVCSINRSQSDALFFEEAKNPILTIEAVQKSIPKKGSFLAMFGFGKIPSQTSQQSKTAGGYSARSVASISLKEVNLQQGPFSAQSPLGMEAFKKEMGASWRVPYLTVRVCEDSNGDGYCFDEPKKNQLAFEVPQFKAPGFPKSLQIDVWSGRYLSLKQNPHQCETQYSPLVFDLKGDGLNLIGPDSGVQFDLDDTGYPVRTGWIAKGDDALLVRDLNGSRKIESGAELFGSATELPSGEKAINGFEALRPLDSDQSGTITPRDKEWTDLRLWIDANQDGISQRRELMTLDRAGVESIDLGYYNILEVDSHGNQTRERSTFIRKVRNKRYVLPVSDVWFNTY